MNLQDITSGQQGRRLFLVACLVLVMLVLVLIFRPTGIVGERLAVKKA